MKKIFDLEVNQNIDEEVLDTDIGDLLLSMHRGGSFSGEKMNGKVESVGFGFIQAPTATQNNEKLTLLLTTDDDEKIVMEIDAMLNLKHPSDEEKMIAGEKVDPGRYYYSGVVRFHTGAPTYKWLERKYFACKGIIETWEHIHFGIYMVEHDEK